MLKNEFILIKIKKAIATKFTSNLNIILEILQLNPQHHNIISQFHTDFFTCELMT